jgi:hypothetical protein
MRLLDVRSDEWQGDTYAAPCIWWAATGPIVPANSGVPRANG